MKYESSNPPAFPHQAQDMGGGVFKCLTNGGLSTRDYFAAKAMQGILSNPDSLSMSQEDVVTQSFHLADAMLAARSKEGE